MAITTPGNCTMVNALGIRSSSLGGALDALVSATGFEFDGTFAITTSGTGVTLAGAVGAAATAALLAGGGTSTSPASTSTADKNFLGFWTKSTATSGASRAMYLRHYIAGAGGNGDCLRSFATVDVVGAAGAAGIHATMQVNTGKTITGLGVGVRATATLAGAGTQGSIYPLMIDAQAGNFSGSITEWAPILVRCSGSGTKPKYLAVIGDAEGEVDTTDMFVAATNATIDHALKVKVNGTDYWIGLYDSPS